MKRKLLTIIAIAITHTSFAQWVSSENNIYNTNSGNVGIGTTSPGATLDVGKLLKSGELGSILARLSEGNGVGSGTYLGVRGYNTQPNTATPNLTDVKSFSIEHGFYGSINGSINFLRGGGATDGAMSFSTYNNTERMRIASNGNIGIGTTNPQYKLDVNGAIRYGANFLGRLGDEPGFAAIVGGVNAGIKFYTSDGVSQPLTLTSDGNVGIGTNNTHSYKLAVNGNVIATSVTVKLYDSWPDYVFKPSYNLPSLSDVKTYIDQNHRLPEMPSENQVAKEGINLGEIVKLQTKKLRS